MNDGARSTPGNSRLPHSRTALDLALLVALTLAINAPFVGQAFHLDDVQYVDLARNVLRDPIFPLDLPYVFQGEHYNFWGYSHPPLNSYFIAGLLLMHPGPASEVFLHSAYLFFPLLAVVSFYFLARRFVRNALVAAALFATGPTLVVSSHTLMADVPLLALMLCATALFLRGIDRPHAVLALVSALALSGACFLAYQGFALIPLLAFYAFRRRQLGRRQVAVLIVPFLLMACWQLAGYVHRGVPYFSPMFELLGSVGIWRADAKVRTAISMLGYLGGIILFFPFVFWKMGRLWGGAISWIGLAVGVVVVYTRLPDYTLPQQLFYVGCVGGGVVTLLWAIHGGIHAWSQNASDTDDLFLRLWFLGALAGCVLAFYSGSARYLLPACPALVLLLVRANEGRASTLFYSALLAVQLVLGVALARSDYQFAEVGRRVAQDFESKYLVPRKPFLFSAEWGMRYYLTTAGGEIMAGDTTGAEGTLVLKSRFFLGRTFDSDLDRSLQLVERHVYTVNSPWRVLTEDKSHAGFWSDGWGVLPFWFSNEPLDEVSVYRVVGELNRGQ